MNRIAMVDPRDYDGGFFFVEIPAELDADEACAVLSEAEDDAGGRTRPSRPEIAGVIDAMTWKAGYGPYSLRHELRASFFYRPRSIDELVYGPSPEVPAGPEDILVEPLQDGRPHDICVREEGRWNVLSRSVAIYLVRAWREHGKEGPSETGFRAEMERRWPGALAEAGGSP